MKRLCSILFLFLIFIVYATQGSAQTAISTESVIEAKSGGFKFPDGSVQSVPPQAIWKRG